MKNERSNNIFLSEGKISAFNEDALDFLPKLKDKSIDLIYCDLPYGTTQCKWDEVIPFDKMWKECERVIKENGAIVFHAQQPFTSALIMSNPKMFKYSWVWEKSKATGFLNAKIRPLVAHEDILVFAKTKPPYFPQMTNGTAYNKGVRKEQTNNDVYGSFDQVEVKSEGLRYPRSVQYFKTAESEGKTWHKTQKPLDLCKHENLNTPKTANSDLGAVISWVAVEKELPDELETVWISNGKGWTTLGCLVYAEGGWHWAETNGVIYQEKGKIVSECESDDLDVKFWHRLPEPPCL